MIPPRMLLWWLLLLSRAAESCSSPSFPSRDALVDSTPYPLSTTLVSPFPHLALPFLFGLAILFFFFSLRQSFIFSLVSSFFRSSCSFSFSYEPYFFKNSLDRQAKKSDDPTADRTESPSRNPKGKAATGLPKT